MIQKFFTFLHNFFFFYITSLFFINFKINDPQIYYARVSPKQPHNHSTSH
jgi:hypothetical protein